MAKKAAKKKRTRTMHVKAAKEELKRNPKSKRKNARKLTARQTLFVDYYLGGAKCNATQAARMAGYSEKSLGSEAAQLMANPKVKEYLRRRKNDLKRRLEISQERIAGELAALTSAKATDFAQWKGNRITVKSSDEIPDALAGAIKGIKPAFDRNGHPVGIELSFYDKVAASRLLAQMTGWLERRGSVAGKGQIIEFLEGLHKQAEEMEDDDAPDS